MFVGVNVGVASSRNKLALLRNLSLKSQSSIFYSFWDIFIHTIFWSLCAVCGR